MALCDNNPFRTSSNCLSTKFTRRLQLWRVVANTGNRKCLLFFQLKIYHQQFNHPTKKKRKLCYLYKYVETTHNRYFSFVKVCLLRWHYSYNICKYYSRNPITDTILNHEHDILTQVSLWYVNRNCQHLRAATEVRLMLHWKLMHENRNEVCTQATISNVFVGNPAKFILAGGCLNV